MFDPKRTAGLITGGLTAPRETWEKYLGQNPPWQATAIQLTIPMVLAAIIIGWLLALIFGTTLYWGYGHGLLISLIIAPLAALLNIALVGFAVSYLSAVFDGQPDFNRGFAAVTLAAIPAYAGSALASIPWLGWLFSLIGGITSLVFLYKIIPLALGVPDNRRVFHFIVTLLVVFVINILLALLLGLGTAGQTMTQQPMN